MSQAGKLFDGTIAPDIETLTSNTGGPVSPDAAFNIDLLGGTGINGVGVPASNQITFSVDADGFETVTAQTTGVASAQLFTITLADLSAVQIFASVSAAIADYSAAYQGTANGGARRSGGGAVLIGSPIISFNEDSGGGPAVDITVSGNDVRVTVSNDVALEVWNYRALIQFVLLDV